MKCKPASTGHVQTLPPAPWGPAGGPKGPAGCSSWYFGTNWMPHSPRPPPFVGTEQSLRDRQRIQMLTRWMRHARPPGEGQWPAQLLFSLGGGVGGWVGCGLSQDEVSRSTGNPSFLEICVTQVNFVLVSALKLFIYCRILVEMTVEGSSEHIIPPESRPRGCWGTETPRQPPHLNKDGEKGERKHNKGLDKYLKMRSHCVF